MADLLSISNLLSLLEVDRQNDAIRLCDEAEGLRRRHYYAEAIKADLHAERIAHGVFDYELQGATLLYLSTIYAYRLSPGDDELAFRYCARAIRSFSLDSHNYAIAQLIRAQIELQIGQADRAAIHFYQITQALQKLIALSRERRQQDRVELYESFYNAANAAIAQIYASLIEVKPVPITPKRTRRPPAVQGTPTTQPLPERQQPSQESSPMDLPVPMQIVWPAPTSLTINPSPVFISATEQAVIQTDLNEGTINYIELSEISINGKPFAIQPICPIPGDPSNALKIFPDKQYDPVLIQADEGKDEYNNTYLLVRRQDRPDHDKQYIVVVDPISKRVWVDLCESKVPYPHFHIIGADVDIPAGSETDSSNEQGLHMLGIVEAWLKPLT